MFGLPTLPKTSVSALRILCSQGHCCLVQMWPLQLTYWCLKWVIAVSGLQTSHSSCPRTRLLQRGTCQRSPALGSRLELKVTRKVTLLWTSVGLNNWQDLTDLGDWNRLSMGPNIVLKNWSSGFSQICIIVELTVNRIFPSYVLKNKHIISDWYCFGNIKSDI